MTIAIRFGLLLAALAPLLSGCGSSDPEPAGGDIQSESGLMSGKFVFEPAEPVVGKNRLDATLFGAEQQPLEHAVLEVEPWMPVHGHGSSATPVVENLGSGHYGITNLVFEMPGEWVVNVDVVAAEIDDRFVIPVEVH